MRRTEGTGSKETERTAGRDERSGPSRGKYRTSNHVHGGVALFAAAVSPGRCAGRSRCHFLRCMTSKRGMPQQR